MPTACPLAQNTAMPVPSAIHIADYDPDWPMQAATAISALRVALPGLFVEIEHIGSTAVLCRPNRYGRSSELSFPQVLRTDSSTISRATDQQARSR